MKPNRITRNTRVDLVENSTHDDQGSSSIDRTNKVGQNGGAAHYPVKDAIQLLLDWIGCLYYLLMIS